MFRRSVCVLALPAFCLCAACDEADAPGACFPIADGADVERVARPGERHQDTRLRGEPRPDREPQGTGSQDDPRAELELQGSTMQGSTMQGSTMQGSTMQGSGMQGSGMQGSTMQGSTMQGMNMQGADYQGVSYQGTSAQGESWQGTEQQSAYLGLADLNGARLELADTRALVTLADGRLVPAEDDEPLRDAQLAVTTSDGREFPAQVIVRQTEAGDRIVVRVDGRPVCAPGDEGMFVAGAWDETGAHAIAGDELTYSCMSGVIAKCVDWGYTPWGVGADVHQACTRLARADYCGDGHPWTLDGTMIDVYDELGVQTPVDDPAFTFEAAWAEHGAVCVNEMRWLVEDGDGRRVQPACFAGLPACASLEQAAAHGAILANDSAHTVIDACE